MAVNHEVKGQLARLLATEDLIVEHKKVSTACFNVHSRVLTLPLWERASGAIYDMLVAHEVGHALYTPDENWLKEYKIPPSFVNIVEDVRVEKLMKRRYAGLNKTMHRGYKEFHEDDFFSIGEEDPNEYNLADRVNLHYKIGAFVEIKFTDEEKSLVKLIGDCETFEDVLKAAELLYDYCKQEKVEDISAEGCEMSGNQDGQASDFVETPSEEGDSGEDGNSEEGDTETGENNPQLDVPSFSSGGQHHEEPETKTDRQLQDAIEELANMGEWANENVYVEFPTLNLDSVIASNKEVHDVITKFWKHEEDDRKQYGEEKNVFHWADTDYNEFKNSAKKEVNYLVKEFECRKAADSYARATTARTGVLDCSKLHTYKYNEDLFQKVTTLADGKSHGLIFILDWSGSMDRVLLSTIKQLYNLIWFCKKVSIPFDVYAFTNEWNCVTYDENNRAIFPTPHHKKIDGHLVVDEQFALMNFFTSKTKNSELEAQMRNIYRIAYASYNRYHYSHYGIPVRLGLSGTPLNESLIALNQIIPQFKQKNKLQKVHTIVLTDGDAPGLNYYNEYTWQDETRIGVKSFRNNKCCIRDRKTGNVYSPDAHLDSAAGFTDMIIRYLRNRNPEVSFIGMRILSSGESGSFMRRYMRSTESISKAVADWKKQKSFSMKECGYHTYFGLSSTALSNDTGFVVSDCASKTEIRNAFKKYLSAKKLNKKVLNEFVQLIA